MTLNELLGVDGKCALCDPNYTDKEKYTDFFNGLYMVSVGKISFNNVKTGNDIFMIAVKTFLLADLFRKGTNNFLKIDYKKDLGLLHALVKELVAAPNLDALDSLCEKVLADTKVSGASEFLKASLMALLEVVDARGRAVNGAA